MAARFSSVLSRCVSSAVKGPAATAGDQHGGSKLWRLLSVAVAVPGVLICYLNAFVMNTGHQDPPEFIPYQHLRLRTKKFPWGDGNHSLFHNSHMNPLPAGYENLD